MLGYFRSTTPFCYQQWLQVLWNIKFIHLPLKITNSLAIFRLRKPPKTSTRLAGHRIWTRDLPNATLVRYHCATSLGCRELFVYECESPALPLRHLARLQGIVRLRMWGLCWQSVVKPTWIFSCGGLLRTKSTGHWHVFEVKTCLGTPCT